MISMYIGILCISYYFSYDYISLSDHNSLKLLLAINLL